MQQTKKNNNDKNPSIKKQKERKWLNGTISKNNMKSYMKFR